MKQIVILSGAGISAESGLKTFRDADGLWEGHDVTKVASPEGFKKDPALVLDFYNQRRRQAHTALPSRGHIIAAELQDRYSVTIITQNVDNLHERAGSGNVIHLHGELDKAQSTANPKLITILNGADINIGDKCARGSQLRPFIVWFGESVPKMQDAIAATKKAHALVVVGTSMQVYPAASLVQFVPPGCPIFVVDPQIPDMNLGRSNEIYRFPEPASSGMEKVRRKLADFFS